MDRDLQATERRRTLKTWTVTEAQLADVFKRKAEVLRECEICEDDTEQRRTYEAQFVEIELTLRALGLPLAMPAADAVMPSMDEGDVAASLAKSDPPAPALVRCEHAVSGACNHRTQSRCNPHFVEPACANEYWCKYAPTGYGRCVPVEKAGHP